VVDLCVAGQVTVDVTAQIDGVILAWLLFNRPHLLLAERRARRVDLAAERLRRQILARMVHQPYLHERHNTSFHQLTFTSSSQVFAVF